jgi:hypothetical protein
LPHSSIRRNIGCTTARRLTDARPRRRHAAQLAP